MAKEISLKLTEPQRRFVFSNAPHPGMVAGYGAGKSQAAVTRVGMLALKYPRLSFGFIEPTYDLIRLIAFPRFSEMFNEWGIDHDINKSEAIIKLENGSQIICRSADNPERLVGFEIADGVVDEIDTLRTEQAAEVWAKMLARCRQNKPDGGINSLGAVSTPEGFKFFYQRFKNNPAPGYELIKAPTRSNPYLPDGYVDQLHATYSSSQLAAYLDGEFVNLAAGSVYPEFDRTLNATQESVKDVEMIHVGMDFNVTNMAAVIHVLRGDEPHAVDELTGIYDTPTMARVLKDRYPNHRIMVYPDASGNARKTVNASESDHAILRAAGFQVCVNSRNPRVKDRILSVNHLIHNSGVRRYKVNPETCPSLVEALEKQSYDKNGEPDKSSGFDHIVDAAGYILVYRYPIVHNRAQFAQIVGI